MPSETHETGIVSSASALASERARGRRMEIPAAAGGTSAMALSGCTSCTQSAGLVETFVQKLL